MFRTARLLLTYTYGIYHSNENFILFSFHVFAKVANIRKFSKIANFHTHLFFVAPKIFNFGRNNDAVENRMGGSESPSHGLVYPS